MAADWGPPPPQTVRLCPGCGANGPAQHSTCSLCQTPFGTAMLPPPVGGMHWVQVRMQVTCMQCSKQSPVESLDIEGRFFCTSCGRDAMFVQDVWQETVLPFASAVGDYFWARLGAFPPWPGVIPDKDTLEDLGEPWSEHADILPSSLRDNFPHLGVDRPRLRILTTGMTLSSAGMRTRGFLIELAPGHPLCPRCHAPMEASGARGTTTLRCVACATGDTYRAPDQALRWCAELVGVVAPDHVQGKAEVRIEAEAGTAAVAIKCPSCGSPLTLAPDERFATCAYCKTSSLVPTGVLAQAFRKASPLRPWWLALQSPSALRQVLQAVPGAGGGILVVPPGSSVPEVVRMGRRGGDGAGPNIGLWVGLVIGGASLLGGLGIALWASQGASVESEPTPLAVPAMPAEKTAAPAPAPTPAPVAGCVCVSGDGARQPRIDARLGYLPRGGSHEWELDVTTHPAGQPYVSMGSSSTLETHDSTVPPLGVGPTLHIGIACDGTVVAFVSGKTMSAWSTASMHLVWTATLPAAAMEPAGGGIACFPLGEQGDAVVVPLANGKRVTVPLATGKWR
jgi:hypothetical protein